MRSISDKEQLSLKAATRRAFDMAGGPEEFQHMTRVRQSVLSKYGSTTQDCADKFIPVDVAVEADVEAGSPIITAKMAHILGYKLVPVAADTVNAAPLGVHDALRIANEAADVVKAITSALTDGRIDQAEEREIAHEIEEAIKVLRDALTRVSVRP